MQALISCYAFVNAKRNQVILLCEKTAKAVQTPPFCVNYILRLVCEGVFHMGNITVLFT